MSYKKFFTAQNALSEDKHDEKAKDAPATDQPVAQPDKTPDKVGPEPKS